MKIYIDNEHQLEMMNLVFKFIDERVDEEAIQLHVDTILTEEAKKRLMELPPITLQVTTVITPYIENLVPDADFTQYVFLIDANNWEDQLQKLSELDYYQGLPLVIDLDSFQKLKDESPETFSETFIDKLIYFYETVGLYRRCSINMTMTNKVDFDIYNTFVAFMSEEMDNVCFWKYVGWIPENPELYGIKPDELKCSTHCIDGGLIKHDGIYFCPFKNVRLCDISERTEATGRRAVYTFYKEHVNEGCKRL